MMEKIWLIGRTTSPPVISVAFILNIAAMNDGGSLSEVNYTPDVPDEQ